MKISILESNFTQDTVIFLHGTKTPYDSPWMDQIAQLINSQGYGVLRPQFPEVYKTNSQEKDASTDLVDPLIELINQQNLDNPTIVGKSLGAKVAVEYADQFPVNKLVLLGYPLTYSTSELRQLRLEKVNKVEAPVHIIQGEADRFGPKDIVDQLDFADNISLSWIEGVDHNYYCNGENSINSQTLEVLNDELLLALGS